jgi:hypothetical protein
MSRKYEGIYWLIKSLFRMLLFSILISGSIPEICAQATVATNVMEALAQLGLDDSIHIVQVNRNFIIARPKELPNGMVDHALWNSIQKDLRVAKDMGENSYWLHDSPFLSKLFGNGVHSYRRRTLPSLQAVFFLPTALNMPSFFKLKEEVNYYIKLDVDRFPPGSSKFNSGRHFVIEILPHWLLRGCSNQKRIAAQLSNNKLRDEKAHSHKADLKKQTVEEGNR